MKKILQALSFLIIAMVFQNSNATPTGDEFERVEIYQFTTKPQLPENHGYPSYISDMRSLWNNSPQHRQYIEESFENERQKQEQRWNNAGVFGKAYEIFRVDSLWNSFATVTAFIPIACLLTYPDGWALPALALGLYAFQAKECYFIAKGSKGDDPYDWLQLWRWNLPKAKKD